MKPRAGRERARAIAAMRHAATTAGGTWGERRERGRDASGDLARAPAAPGRRVGRAGRSWGLPRSI